MPSSARRWRRRCWPGTRWSASRRRRRRCRRWSWPRSSTRPACRLRRSAASRQRPRRRRRPGRAPDVAGVTFTGSYDVGFKRLYQRFAARDPQAGHRRDGGKNPALVMASADVAQAVQGISRSAFGMNGHKCSACSRVYVHRAVAAELVAGLARAADAVVPATRSTRGCSSGRWRPSRATRTTSATSAMRARWATSCGPAAPC